VKVKTAPNKETCPPRDRGVPGLVRVWQKRSQLEGRMVRERSIEKTVFPRSAASGRCRFSRKSHLNKKEKREMVIVGKNNMEKTRSRSKSPQRKRDYLGIHLSALKPGVEGEMDFDLYGGKGIL